MKEKTKFLTASQTIFVDAKKTILMQWLSYDASKEILSLHNIDRDYFLEKYASGVFDYFMGVISGDVELGNCPVMKGLLSYLKEREISADELFAICTNFRRSMVDFSYDKEINSKELFKEISYIFDENFKGILKFYTDTIFQKLVDARQEAIQANQAKEYFLSNISHEIRTPLNAILGFVNLLLDDDISKKHRNYLEIIHSSGENLLTIINDILDFSKLRSGEFSIEEKAFSLHEEMSHTMELFVASANVKDITITSFIDPQIPVELFGDALRIKQILSNFLSNAIKFTSKGGVVEVSAFYKEGELEVSVSDNGIGIDTQDIQNIFTAFAQVQNALYINSIGTGLGLSICKQLIEKMDGTLHVSSELNKGSCFTMKLPIKAMTLECQMFEDIGAFRELKMHLYSKSKDLSYKLKSFLKYADIFGMNTQVVDTLEGDFDICIFVYEDMDEEAWDQLLKSSKKFVALMSKEYDKFDTYEHITCMCYPLYCAKIHLIFSELMNPSKSQTIPKVSLKSS
ncbi:MAG: ATP-binding protein [Sulfurimonas sp.]|nr:ATP-binding protein [Sulfurimonas sp.]